MAKKGKKKKEAPPPPAPESEVELAPPSDARAVPDGGASFGRWSLVTLPKRSFAVLLHEGGTAVMLPAKYEAFVYARERPSPEMVALQRRLAERLEAKKAKAGPTAKFEEIQALDAEIAEARRTGAIDEEAQRIESALLQALHVVPSAPVGALLEPGGVGAVLAVPELGADPGGIIETVDARLAVDEGVDRGAGYVVDGAPRVLQADGRLVHEQVVVAGVVEVERA